jgi:hypothetical protein
LAVLVFSAGASDGTTVVILRSETYIVIGADSLVSISNPRGTALPGFSSCKIMTVGRFAIALTGTVAQGGVGGFNAYAMLKNIALQEKTAVAIADRFDKVARTPYQKLLLRFLKNNPKGFDRACRNKDCLQLIVADYNGGHPAYAARSIKVVLKENVPTVEITANDCPNPASTTYVIQSQPPAIVR